MIVYAYKAWFKTSNVKLTTHHFINQTLFVWKHATTQQRIITILMLAALGLSLPILDLLSHHLIYFAHKKTAPS
ncbi:PepSY-associated TM helix domain-containing protein [Acinetobacter baumannii]|nr:PepSY-associated TM helix domain-containing protein [Acinetobacter baumannii]